MTDLQYAFVLLIIVWQVFDILFFIYFLSLVFLLMVVSFCFLLLASYKIFKMLSCSFELLTLYFQLIFIDFPLNPHL